MRREKQGKPVKWSLSSRVIANLLRRKVDIRLRCIRRKGTQGHALEIETRAIRLRIKQGVSAV